MRQPYVLSEAWLITSSNQNVHGFVLQDIGARVEQGGTPGGSCIETGVLIGHHTRHPSTVVP